MKLRLGFQGTGCCFSRGWRVRCNTWEARTFLARLRPTVPSEQGTLVHYYSSGFLPRVLQYLLYASWNMFLQGILAFSLVQIRNDPPIFR